MGYIGAIVILLLLFLALHYFSELNKRTKIAIASFFGLLVAFGVAYNSYNQKEQERIMQNEIRYNQGKSLTCKDIKVDRDSFSYSVGTQTLIGRKDSPHAGVMIDIAQCH